ncbi:MAG: SusC/RagA family TonB-linked outer membrane protein [Longimicrobiales bacterium]
MRWSASLLGLILVVAAPAAGSVNSERDNRAPVGSVTGRVTESGTGQPVTGAVVMVVGTQLTALTDVQGRYLLNQVPAGQRTISVRRLGYADGSQTVNVTDNASTTLDFTVNTLAVQLSEVVVTATGEQRKLEIGNVVASVSVASVVAAAPITNVTDVLQGRVAGVMTFANSGITGSAPRIRIRGFNSLSQSNAPLMIIDGVRVENTTGAAGNLGAGTSYGWSSGAVTQLNPEEIASLDIVKGPSAATLYGTDGANGVILITTKRGQEGRARFTMYTEGGIIQQQSRWNDTYYAFGRTPAGAQTRCNNLLRIGGGCTLDSLSVWSPMRDAPSSPIGTGNRKQLGLQISGGVQQFRYFISSELEDETGYLQLSNSEITRLKNQRGGAAIPDEQIRPNYLKRAALRGNISTRLGENADIRISTAIGLQKVQLPGSGIFSNAAWGPGFNDANEGWQNGVRPGESFAVRSAENLTRVTTGLTGNWSPRSWLTTRATVGLDFSSMFSDNLQRRGEGGTPANPSLGRRAEIRSATTLYTVDLGSSASFNLTPSITSRSSIGAQYNRRNAGSVLAQGTNLPPGSSTLAGAATLSNAEQTVESVIAGAYGEQMFGLSERIFVTGALRADGASSFGKNFRTAFYPKASMSWLLSDESFFPDISFLNSLRYRLAYGASGVQPDAIAALPRLQFVTVFVNGATATGAQLQALGNPNLKPERVSEVETGLDADLFAGRLHAEATFYYRRSVDALVQRSMPRSIGITGTGQLDNVGSVRNRGVELDVRAQVLKWRGVEFDLNVNGSINSNKLLKLDPTLRPPEDRFVKFVEGYPLFSQWDRRVKSWNDANGDGILVPEEVVVGDSIEYLGNTNPTQMLNLIPKFTLLEGRLQFSTMFVYRGDWIQTNFSELNKCNIGGCRARNDPNASLREQAAYIAFTKPGLTYAGYQEDGTYTRWAEASVSYNVHENLLRSVGLGVRDATITLSARNLKLWTNYTGLDPEVAQNPGLAGNFGTLWDLGYDNPVSPQSRYFILRMTLGF